MSVADLPDLSPEANARIDRALNEAAALLEGTSTSVEKLTNAMLHFLDAMAWEYMSTRSVQQFEDLTDAICEKAMGTFNGSSEALGNRKHYWTTEAREREANGITGERIPIRPTPMSAFVFNDLRSRFLLMQGQTDLTVIFLDGGRKEFGGGPEDPVARDQLHADFATLARRAMAALGFKFNEPARSVSYWLELLRQESPHFKLGRISNVCLASAEFCNELETRALEAIVAYPPYRVTDESLKPTDQTEAKATSAVEVDNQPVPALEADSQPAPTATADNQSAPAVKEDKQAVAPVEANNGPARQIRKRGPKRDYETASQVAEIVKQIAPDGKWRSELDEICDALDEQEIPMPKPWRPKHGFRNWCEAGLDKNARGRHMAIEAIKHHLKLAKEAPTETIP